MNCVYTANNDEGNNDKTMMMIVETRIESNGIEFLR